MYASIQPTYEELKPRKQDYDGHRAACIQPTYEELKPLKNAKIAFTSVRYPAYL